MDGKALLDLSFGEDSEAQVDMNVVMTGSGHLVEIQGTAEKEPFHKNELDQLLQLAAQGIEFLISAQRESLGEIAAKIGPLSSKKRLLLASFNEGKINELREILAPLPLEIKSLRDVPGISPVQETGSTFEENAVLKAETYAKITGEMVLADDSGLEVQYLDGKPGVYSARFAGEGATDEQNNTLLLKMMEKASPAERKARFVCVIALAARAGRRLQLRESARAVLLMPAGKLGFGYDPLFLPWGNKTFAEIDPDTKTRSATGKSFKKAGAPEENLLR